MAVADGDDAGTKTRQRRSSRTALIGPKTDDHGIRGEE
jgi:hypothetical protein